MSDRYLIAGLGNPGRQYKQNRHNVGFHVVDHLAARHGLTFSRLQDGAFVTSGTIAGRSVVLAKPQRYMNVSGRPVVALLRFYQIAPERLMVIYDDLDLPVGTIRLRPEGGSGGHNGMKSIIQQLGTQGFPRLRVGIDRPPGRMDPAAYVLQDFSAQQLPIVHEALDRAADAIELWLREGIELAMSRCNGPAPAPPAVTV